MLSVSLLPHPIFFFNTYGVARRKKIKRKKDRKEIIERKIKQRFLNAIFVRLSLYTFKEMKSADFRNPVSSSISFGEVDQDACS